jgi:hypothetical protein
MADLLAYLGESANYFTAADAFTALASARSEFAGMNYDALAMSGRMLQGAAETAGAAR